MKRIAALFLVSTLANADPYVSVGYDARLRSQSFDVNAGYLFDNGLGVEVGYQNMGEQPDGYENINKFVSFNVVGYFNVMPWLNVYGKVGTHNSKYSYNGTNDYNRSGDSLWGANATGGAEIPLYKDSVFLFGQVTVYEYRQVDNGNMGGFHKPSLGVRVAF